MNDERKIHEKLDAIHTDLSTHLARCEACRAQVAEHDLALNGSPENGGKPGLRLRVASLEQSRAHYRWGLRALWAAVLSGLGALIFGKH